MKVVWVAQDLHVGGGQRVICELAGKLVQRGYDVEIIYPKGRGGYRVPEGVKATPVGVEIKSAMLSLFTNVPFTVAAVPVCDWVICSMPVSAFTGFVAGRLRSARILYYVMNDERALFDDRSLLNSNLLIGVYHGLTDLAHKLPVTIAVNSRWTGTTIRRAQANEYPIIPHGIDPAIFTPEGDTIQKDDTFTIATIGRRHRWKGLGDLIEALNKLKRLPKGVPPFQLLIVTQDDLDLKAAEFDSRIIKPAGDNDIAAVLRSADLFVHPSWFEGFGLPPLEAMACGTPTVITDSGGVSEFAIDGENCQLVPPRDPASLAEAISSLMNDPDAMKKFSSSGINTAREFTWDHAADTLEEILKKES